VIYYRFNVTTQIKFNVPEYAALREEFEDSSNNWYRMFADSIFRFLDKETIYTKDRLGTNYQYSGEEMVVISLSAMLLY